MFLLCVKILNNIICMVIPIRILLMVDVVMRIL